MDGEAAEIWITGIGIISAAGCDLKQSTLTLQQGISPLKAASLPYSVHNNKYVCGSVDLTNVQLSRMLGLSPDNTHNRTTLLALYAAQQALAHAGIRPEDEEITLINATTVGGMSNTELSFDSINAKETRADKTFIDEMDCGNIGRSMQSYFNIPGDHYTLSTACSSGSNGIMLGARLIRSGKAGIVLAGGSDSLSKFVLNGFLSLKNVDPALCKPFDNARAGLNLGEGAAYFVLEEKCRAEARNAQPLAKISGYNNISETYHMTGSSPDGEGAFKAMTGAITMAGLSPHDISFVHTHGTSTVDNDLAESAAIKKIFDGRVQFASSKTYTGHTLAASGCISMALTITMMQNNFLFPSLNFATPIEGPSLTPVTRIENNVRLEHCLINSFGFGGNNTSLLISRVL